MIYKVAPGVKIHLQIIASFHSRYYTCSDIKDLHPTPEQTKEI